MRLGLYADPHFSQSSSIIVGRQTRYNGRLDNLIESFNWMNNLFKEQQCDRIICLGDLTDKPVLTAEEITALSECHLENHYFIIGNHCRSDKNGQINSLSIFKNIYYEPTVINTPEGNSILILPYSSTPIDLTEFKIKPTIILSHNDIKGYDFGGHISEEGYDINSILNNCSLFINGHLHNGGWIVKDRIVNIGQLSGMNFASCNGEWEPSVMILDTETLELQLYVNPVAYRFKKVEFDTLSKLKGYLDNLPEEGKYVLQIKLPSSIATQGRKLVNQSSRVTASRILTVYDKKKKQQIEKQLFKEDISIYDKLKKFIVEQNSNYSLEIINQVIDKIAQIEEGVG